ncbi:hypothetical protein EGW08_001504, partial [Elysia chlorotica]
KGLNTSGIHSSLGEANPSLLFCRPILIHAKALMLLAVIYFEFVFKFEDDDNEEDAPLEKKKKIFSKELRCMMYGFGDDQNPYTESVDLVEDLVIDYITEMTKKAMEIGKSGRIIVEDLIFLIRKDPKKYSRVKELLLMNEELRKARKAFDEIKYATSTK